MTKICIDLPQTGTDGSPGHFDPGKWQKCGLFGSFNVHWFLLFHEVRESGLTFPKERWEGNIATDGIAVQTALLSLF